MADSFQAIGRPTRHRVNRFCLPADNVNMSRRQVGFAFIAVVAAVGLFLGGRSSVNTPFVQSDDPHTNISTDAGTNPLASGQLTATFVGEDGCLTPEARAFGLGMGLSSANDTFTLREPGDGTNYGALVAVSSTSQVVGDCYIEVTFQVPGGVQFFEVANETEGMHWGPFDPAQLAANGWRVTLS